MFGIGMPELILILVIALLIFGPKKLPEISKALGKGMHELKKAGDDLKETWEAEVRAQEKELGLKEAPSDSAPKALSPEADEETGDMPQLAEDEVYGSPSLAYPGEDELLRPPRTEEAAESSDRSHLAYPSPEELAKPVEPSGTVETEGSSKTDA